MRARRLMVTVAATAWPITSTSGTGGQRQRTRIRVPAARSASAADHACQPFQRVQPVAGHKLRSLDGRRYRAWHLNVPIGSRRRPPSAYAEVAPPIGVMSRRVPTYLAATLPAKFGKGWSRPAGPLTALQVQQIVEPSPCAARMKPSVKTTLAKRTRTRAPGTARGRRVRRVVIRSNSLSRLRRLRVDGTCDSLRRVPGRQPFTAATKEHSAVRCAPQVKSAIRVDRSDHRPRSGLVDRPAGRGPITMAAGRRSNTDGQPRRSAHPGHVPVPKVSTNSPTGWATPIGIRHLDLASGDRQPEATTPFLATQRRVRSQRNGRPWTGPSWRRRRRRGGHAAVGVDDDLAAGQSGVTLRTTDHEAAGRVDEPGYVLVVHVRPGVRREFPAARRAAHDKGARWVAGRCLPCAGWTPRSCRATHRSPSCSMVTWVLASGRRYPIVRSLRTAEAVGNRCAKGSAAASVPGVSLRHGRTSRPWSRPSGPDGSSGVVGALLAGVVDTWAISGDCLPMATVHGDGVEEQASSPSS